MNINLTKEECAVVKGALIAVAKGQNTNELSMMKFLQLSTKFNLIKEEEKTSK